MGLQREHSDLDVVIKGVDNMQLLRKKLDEVPLVSELHITEALDRYEKIGYNFSRNDFPKMIAQRWAVIKKGNDSLKLHFTYRNSEIPTNPLPKKLNHEIILEGKVVNDVGTCFMPRRFTLETNKGIYTVLTYFWQFYHAVKTGDFVRIYGVQNAENSKIVVLRDRRIHGLQFIK